MPVVVFVFVPVFISLVGDGTGVQQGRVQSQLSLKGVRTKTWTWGPWALYTDPVQKEGPCFVLTPLKVHYGQHDH